MPFDRPSEQKCAEYYLFSAVLMFKQKGYNLRHFLKLAVRMWDHTQEERIRLEKWQV